MPTGKPDVDVPPSLDDLEKATLTTEDHAEVPPSDIVAYNELRSCADLYRMHTQRIIDIHPDFQREVVWKDVDQTRFIDSLIKQLPIPSMCFAMDHKLQKWIVIDGLQRMSAIIRFLSGGDWNLSELDDIEPNLSGRNVSQIKDGKPELRQYFTRVENLSIPITVLRCDFSKKTHLEYLFTIFHRLNTGGIKLNNQEIRNCIYGGPFNDLLKRLDKFPAWRRLHRMKPNNQYRFTKQELILRFLAFTDKYEKYDGHLAKFLNTYMHDHRHATPVFLNAKTDLFTRTVSILFLKALSGKPPRKLTISLLEGALVGIGRNVDALEGTSSTEVRTRFQSLGEHPHFSEGSLVEGLSKKPKVIERLKTAVEIFAG